MTHNTEGENPLDAPNIQEETNALPSNGSRLYNNNKKSSRSDTYPCGGVVLGLWYINV